MGLKGYLYKKLILEKKVFEEEQKKKKREKRRRELEEESKQRELEEEERRRLINRVIQSIIYFEPFLKYENEITYHIDLARHLKNEFPNLEIERQKGASRPDIVINDIAIEVKGPTDFDALNTIASKCMRYSKHFQHLVIVLFEVRVNQNSYEEWLSGLKETFPNVKVIKKSNNLNNTYHSLSTIITKEVVET